MRNNLITNDEQEQASAFARLRGVLTRQCAKRFAQVEEGSLIVFALFIFVMMMLFGGIAVDVMHAETVRTTMQSTLDRAVLAAADLDQTVDGEDVVDDYFAKAGMGHLDYDVVVTETGAGPIITSRRVDAKANANIGTFFMRMSGYPYLQSPASGAAMEGVTHIEISLVLDVSGSMGNYSRLTNLKVAAKDFIDDIFENDEGDKVSVSIIPYSTQVSAGPTLLSYYNATAEHSYSHCVEFTANDFLSASLSDTDQLQRAGHFDPWTSKNDDDGAEDLVCRNESHFHIQPFSNDITALKNQITAFTANGNTSIDIGVKWGAALLDDDTQELVTEMVDDGHVIEAFDGRPLTYSNGNVLKVIVVMTDGVNTSQYYLNDDYRSGLSPIYRRPSNGRFSMASVEKNDEDNDNDYREPYFYAAADTRTFLAEVEVANADGKVPAGISAQVRIPTGEVSAHFLSPAILSLGTDGTLGIKTVADGDTVVFTPITIVRAQTDGIWVTGLPDASRIITVGQGYVNDGEVVAPQPGTTGPTQ